jgi:hypothetical protein
MGPSVSKNYVRQGVSEMASVAVSSTQSCQSSVSENQTVSLSGNTGANITVGNINFDQAVTVDVTCLESTEVDNLIMQNVAQVAKQMADAVNQQFGLTAGSFADNTADTFADLATDVSTTFTQTCKSLIGGNQSVLVDDNVGSVISVGDINFNQTVDEVINCVSTNISSTDLDQYADQLDDQSATATVENFLSGIITIIIIIIIVIMVVIFKGVGGLLNWKFLLTIALIIVGYFVLAAIFKWWPFSKSDDDHTNSSTT